MNSKVAVRLVSTDYFRILFENLIKIIIANFHIKRDIHAYSVRPSIPYAVGGCVFAYAFHGGWRRVSMVYSHG